MKKLITSIPKLKSTSIKILVYATILVLLPTNQTYTKKVSVSSVTPTPKKQVVYVNVNKVEETLDEYIHRICKQYNIDPYLIKAMIYVESTNDSKAKNGNCVGLMQVSIYWHKERAKRLGVKDFYNAKQNVLLGVDYVSELYKQTKSIKLTLMLYNMSHERAYKLYKQGKTTDYVKKVLSKKGELTPCKKKTEK